MNSEPFSVPGDDPASEPPQPPTVDADAESKIDLDQFLKAQRLVQSGGQAKHCIQGGEVQVNGEVETRRRRNFAPATWWNLTEARGRSNLSSRCPGDGWFRKRFNPPRRTPERCGCRGPDSGRGYRLGTSD